MARTKTRFLLWIAGLITRLPYTKKRSLLVDRIINYTENEGE